MSSSSPRRDPVLSFHPVKVRWMESVADYASAYSLYLGLLGAFLEYIIARATDIATAAGREGR